MARTRKLSAVTQAQKDKCHVFLLICDSWCQIFRFEHIAWGDPRKWERRDHCGVRSPRGGDSKSSEGESIRALMRGWGRRSIQKKMGERWQNTKDVQKSHRNDIIYSPTITYEPMCIRTHI